MGLKRTDEFRQDAVRIPLTSGLTRKQVADDLGVGMSTLNKWITAHRDTDVVYKEDLGLAQENDRLRRENRLLKEEREILKNRSGLESVSARRFRKKSGLNEHLGRHKNGTGPLRRATDNGKIESGVIPRFFQSQY